MRDLIKRSANVKIISLLCLAAQRKGMVINMENRMQTPAVGALKIAVCVLAAAVVVYIAICVSTGLFYPRFMRGSQKLAAVPGLSDGFIPQGVCYSDSLKAWLVCGYFDDAPSRIYVVGSDGEVQKSMPLYRENGEEYTGHAGGISACGEHIWVSNQKKAFHLTATAVEEAEDDSPLCFDGYFGVGVNASFTFADDRWFWIGEYHMGDKYKTADANHMTSPDGSEHGAIIYGYHIDASEKYGVSTEGPLIALSVRDIVQGFCVTDSGKYVLSTSSALASSHLYIYDCSECEADGTIRYGGRDIPLFYLDSTRLVDTVTLPHMSEDLDYHDGMVVVNFEAGAKKYGFGLLPCSVRHIMGFELD